MKKITPEKNEIFLESKTTIYLSLGLHKEGLSYRRSLQLSTENIQHFKTWIFLIFFDFCGSFLPSWIRIQIRNPDPIDSGSNWDPDPQPWSEVWIRIRLRIRILLSWSKNSKKTLIPTVLWLIWDFLFLKNDVNVP